MAPLHLPAPHKSAGHRNALSDPVGQPSRTLQQGPQRLLPQSLSSTSLPAGKRQKDNQNQMPNPRSSNPRAAEATHDAADPPATTSHTSSMVVPPLLHPHQPPSSLDEVLAGGSAASWVASAARGLEDLGFGIWF